MRLRGCLAEEGLALAGWGGGTRRERRYTPTCSFRSFWLLAKWLHALALLGGLEFSVLVLNNVDGCGHSTDTVNIVRWQTRCCCCSCFLSTGNADASASRCCPLPLFYSLGVARIEVKYARIPADKLKHMNRSYYRKTYC